MYDLLLLLIFLQTTYSFLLITTVIVLIRDMGGVERGILGYSKYE